MRVRFAVHSDLKSCVQMAPQVFFGDNRFVPTLHYLLATGRALSVVVVDKTDRVLGFWLSVFISDWLQDTILSGQHPIRHYLALGAREGHVLSPKQITSAHRGDGLNLLGFQGWQSDNFVKSVVRLLSESFFLLHRGYHLKSFLKEVYGEDEKRSHEQLGCQIYRDHQVQGHYSDFNFRNRHCPYLVGISRDKATCQINSKIEMLFQTVSPKVAIPKRLRSIAQVDFVLKRHFLDLEHPHQQLFFRSTRHNKNINNIFNIYMYRLYKQIRSGVNEKWRSSRRRNNYYERRYLEQHPEVLYPLEIHSLFYNHPELAKSYPLPIRAE